MEIRADLGVHPFRWLAFPAAWALLAAAATWFRSSAASARIDLPPLSNDWLNDQQRRAIRTRDL